MKFVAAALIASVAAFDLGAHIGTDPLAGVTAHTSLDVSAVQAAQQKKDAANAKVEAAEAERNRVYHELLAEFNNLIDHKQRVEADDQLLMRDRTAVQIELGDMDTEWEGYADSYPSAAQ